MRKNTPSGFLSATGSITPQRMAEIDAWVSSEYSPSVQQAVKIFINYIDPQIAQHASIYILKKKLDDAIARYKSDPAFKSGVDKVLKDNNMSSSIVTDVATETAAATTPSTSKQPPADDKLPTEDESFFDTTTIIVIVGAVVLVTGAAVWYFKFRKK